MLTLQYLPYDQIRNLSSETRIKKLINLVKENKILLLEGKLNPFEEAKLIEKTMEQISKRFKGIEICTVYPENKNIEMFGKLRNEILRLLGHRQGLTIIGPATIVKEIKRDPNKIELLTKPLRK